MRTIDEIMRTAPVIPVLVIDDADTARELAEALVAGGLPVLEVTLRTPAALDAIRRMNLVPGAIVGAGTVLNQAQFEEAYAAGAEFVVSPGLSEALAHTAARTGVPFLPGVATASEIMRGLDLGLEHFKFFPAEAAGGLPTLKALAAPFAGVKFCPTGGISAERAPEWLAHPSVLCVGGTWITPRGADRAQVEALARQAAALAR
jgi:2-dehydro-3-deoxyphosphogluconate aldolase / (4S)-4-hydroxy-2-oxoglutarate aldolase